MDEARKFRVPLPRRSELQTEADTTKVSRSSQAPSPVGYVTVFVLPAVIVNILRLFILRLFASVFILPFLSFLCCLLVVIHSTARPLCVERQFMILVFGHPAFGSDKIC